MTELKPGTKCQFEGCDQPATDLATGREGSNYTYKLGAYCSDHAWEIAEIDSPEYNVDCPNCGCRFGVN